MANTLTNLVPTMYEALDMVSREMVGFIAAVNRNTGIERAAKDQSVRVPITPSESTADNTPGVTAPDTGDVTVDNVEVTISKSKHVPVRFNGEETRGLSNAGTYNTIIRDRFYQAMRALVNEIESDLWTEAYQSASRAYGTAGTTPFASAADLSDFAGVLRILEENGAPKSDLQLVLGHAALAQLRGKQSSLFKVNEAGSSDMLRNGMTDRIMSFAIRHSDPITIHTQGTGTSYTLSTTAGEAVGATTIDVEGGSGTIIAGDVVTFAGTTDKYVVSTDLASGSFTIGAPGLVAAETFGDAVTVGADHTPNVALARSACVLAARPPALPEGGDSADDIMQITDPLTGMMFELAHYKQYLQNTIHVRLAWGVKAVKEDHIALLLG